MKILKLEKRKKEIGDIMKLPNGYKDTRDGKQIAILSVNSIVLAAGPSLIPEWLGEMWSSSVSGRLRFFLGGMRRRGNGRREVEKIFDVHWEAADEKMPKVGR